VQCCAALSDITSCNFSIAALSVAALCCLFSVGQVHEYLLLLMFNTKVNKRAGLPQGNRAMPLSISSNTNKVCSSSNTAVCGSSAVIVLVVVVVVIVVYTILLLIRT